ncbi:MAG: class I SAM-dependent rRNA methyltransferase [Desulfurococcales archaeon]|nr:class I SAM-dependent rRNA methyltransferase [Desulfurococcales archaeon]MCE4605265.1 class I SAM-dependent rRNA methyltransferase [Desulfurococcales archaeon]
MPSKVLVEGIGLRKLRRGSSIIYRKWVRPEQGLRPGELVEIHSSEAGLEACGLWEPRGPVAVRVVEHSGCSYTTPQEVIEDRLEDAYRIRERLGYAPEHGMRLVNSDGDLLSGLIIDVYGDVAVLQSSSWAIDPHIEYIAKVLSRLAGSRHVFNKSTQRSRKDIGLEPVVEWIIGRKREVIIEEAGAKFIVDVVNGQKTGFFLDQRMNRLELRRYVGSKVLDVFSYTGAFGIHAAMEGARIVVFVEEDPTAARILRRNLEINRIERYKIYNTSIWSMRRLEDRFDTITVDPPAFIQRGDQDSINRGIKAYRRAYSWSLKHSTPGSTVAYLSSCSYFLTRDNFLKIISEVALEVNDNYRILGSLRGASPDHTMRGEEYLDYLKGAFIWM